MVNPAPILDKLQVDAVLDSPSPTISGEDLFELITTLDVKQLQQVLLHQETVPKAVSARGIRDNLAGLFSVSKADAASLLGTSPSRLSRSDDVDARMLDRTYALADTYAVVAAVLGPSDAGRWFTTPNRGLDDHRPLHLLGSNFGTKRVNELIESLLSGSIV